MLIEGTEGGGTRGYASLLMLQHLVDEIKKLEQQSLHKAGAHNSSFGPVSKHAHEPPQRTSTQMSAVSNGRSISNSGPGQTIRTKHDQYLLCHYFDYIGGTSTGGSVLILRTYLWTHRGSPGQLSGVLLTKEFQPRLSAIMLGRLRMSVAECLALYEDMARRVFGKNVKRTSFWGLWRSKWKASNLEEAIGDIVHRYIPQPDSDLNFQTHLKWLDGKYPLLRRMRAPDDLCKT